MKRNFFIVLSSLLTLVLMARTACGGPIPDGEYIGLEKMESLSPENKAVHWYHQNDLIIKGNAVTLCKSPLTINKGVTEYSASDGGFYSYRGTVVSKNSKIYLRLLLFESDYAAVRLKVNPAMAKKYPGYEKWPVKKQIEKGILVPAKPKPFEDEVQFNNGKLIFQNAVYHKRKHGELRRW